MNNFHDILIFFFALIIGVKKFVIWLIMSVANYCGESFLLLHGKFVISSKTLDGFNMCICILRDKAAH